MWHYVFHVFIPTKHAISTHSLFLFLPFWSEKNWSSWWWKQPIWKYANVKLDHFPKVLGVNITTSLDKPPPFVVFFFGENQIRLNCLLPEALQHWQQITCCKKRSVEASGRVAGVGAIKTIHRNKLAGRTRFLLRKEIYLDHFLCHGIITVDLSNHNSIIFCNCLQGPGVDR